MSDLRLKEKIRAALKAFDDLTLRGSARQLLNTLGYISDKKLHLSPNIGASFLAEFDPGRKLNHGHALIAEWRSVDMLFQLTGDDLTQPSRVRLASSGGRVDNTIIESYLFFAIDLTGHAYTRTQLASITREVNKLFPMPVMLIFRHGKTLTLAIIGRRPNKTDESKDVLQKVTLIKDVTIGDPHRAHVEILFDLSLAALEEKYVFRNFDDLYLAWQETLDSSELNKRFFKEIANWYFWALQHVAFPKGVGADEDARNATSVIRMVTRLIFCWFLKEKGLIPDSLFRLRNLKNLLTDAECLPVSSKTRYYKAILQNLFFATLNVEMNDPAMPRKFRGKNKGDRPDAHYLVPTVYRYEDMFLNAKRALEAFSEIPFLNGGLFECLDREIKAEDLKRDPQLKMLSRKEGNQTVLRVDGFSDRPQNALSMPDFLFFGEEQDADLNAAYSTKNKRYKVRGLINIFYRYKFTISENTPIEEEIALDPELLGRVFENLLAAYNPETYSTARKQTGSFYTPREIVNYMVDESLVVYLEDKLAATVKYPVEVGGDNLHSRLRKLIAYEEEAHLLFDEQETTRLIDAIDNVKILDPACGSGAFPMGMLHKLVFILSRLDPRNEKWKTTQLVRASEFPDPEAREKLVADIERAFNENELDYGRKLYLIENCIYGADIQPIAVQIAKLRFFISLVVDQRIDNTKTNRGVRPLPNLETNFVSANTLLGIERPAHYALEDPDIQRIEKELKRVRERYFYARKLAAKRKYREEEERLRRDLSEALMRHGWNTAVARKLAQWDPYNQNASAVFFDPDWMFGNRSGFDITIGNPPYVRADAGERHLEMRRAIEASGQYETLWEKWDLFIPFIEKGFKLLKPGGTTTMIVSDAYCHSKYAQKSQTWFLQNSRILRLDFFGKIKIFDAAVRNVTYFFQKADGSCNHPLRRVHGPEFGTVHLLPTDEQNRLTYRSFFPEDTHVHKVSTLTIPLESICYISYGLRPSSDEHESRGEFVTADVVSAEKDRIHCKPYVEGKHLANWLPRTNLWLEWGTSRAPGRFCRPTFPQMYEVTEKLIAQRSPGKDRDPVVCYDTQRLVFTPASVGFVPWHYVAGVRNNSLKKAARYRWQKPLRSDLPNREELEKSSRRFAVKFVLAVMNSQFARDVLRANRRSNVHLYPDDWKKLPIPDASASQQAPVVELVDQILAAKRLDPAADVTAMEGRIDTLVNELYGVVPKEGDISNMDEPVAAAMR